MTKNSNVQQVQKAFGDIASTIDAVSDDLTPRLENLIRLIRVNDIGSRGEFVNIPFSRQNFIRLDKLMGTNFADNFWPDKLGRSDKLRKRSMRHERHSL